jgi:hypothetical protein
MSEEEFNGMEHAEELLERCRRTLRMWRGVYTSLGVEFQWREPTAEQMQQAIRIEAERYKDNK